MMEVIIFRSSTRCLTSIFICGKKWPSEAEHNRHGDIFYMFVTAHFGISQMLSILLYSKIM